MNNPIEEMAELTGESPGARETSIARVKTAVSRSDDPNKFAGPRLHGSKVVLDDENIGLFKAISGQDAETHQSSSFTYLTFPINPKYSVIINAIPSYLLPKSTKVEVAISPKGTPQVVADDHALGVMDPSGDLCVILGSMGEFVTWFPTSESEEPWNMTALSTIDDHMHLAKAGRMYRISELESYIGGSFAVVRKSGVYRQER